MKPILKFLLSLIRVIFVFIYNYSYIIGLSFCISFLEGHIDSHDYYLVTMTTAFFAEMLFVYGRKNYFKKTGEKQDEL